MVPVRIRPVPPAFASVRGGFLSLFPAAYGVRSPADAPALTSQGSEFLSPFPRPAKAGHMVGVAQPEERRSAKPCQPRVRIPPRPPGAHMPHRCQKWESPNLSSADSRQRPPAGIEPCPAVIWDSSEDISRQLKSCCKAMRHKPCWRSAHLMKRQMPVRVRPVPPKGIRILQWVSAPAKRYWLLYVAAYNLGISACCDRRRYGSVSQLARERGS